MNMTDVVTFKSSPRQWWWKQELGLMLGCPDCGSLISYQHAPGCKLAVQDGKQNLYTRYKDEFLKGWQGCSHLDCEPTCAPGFCQRLADALARWEGAR